MKFEKQVPIDTEESAAVSLHYEEKCCTSDSDNDNEDFLRSNMYKSEIIAVSNLKIRDVNSLAYKNKILKRGALRDNNFRFSDNDEGIKRRFRPYSEIIENLTNSF